MIMNPVNSKHRLFVTRHATHPFRRLMNCNQSFFIENSILVTPRYELDRLDESKLLMLNVNGLFSFFI